MTEEKKDDMNVHENGENENTERKDNFYLRHKKFCRISGIILVFLILLLLFMGPIVRFCVELAAPAVVGVPVKIGSLSINFFTGNIGVSEVKVGDSKGVNSDHFVVIKRIDVKMYRGWTEVKDIFIANPEGFKERHLLVLKHARVDIDTDTLTAKKLEVEEFYVNGLELYYEPQVNGQNNIEKLEEYVAKTFKLPESGDDQKEAQKLQLEELYLNDINVHTVVFGQSLRLPVIPIELDGLGEGPEGVTASDVFITVLDKLSLGAVDAIKEHASALGKGTMKFLGEAGDQVNSGVDGLKNLFRKQEKK